MPVEGIVAPPMVESCIPWSYNRNQVPDLFARKEVPLDAWKRAVDSAETLFKDRYAALERAKRPWEMCVWMTLSMYLFVLIKWTFHLFQAGGASVADYTLYALCVTFFLFFTFFLKSMAMPRLPIILDQISSQFEEQWSHQVGNLNAIYQEYLHHRARIYKQRQGARP
jgi:hypothetical protein